VRMRGGGVAKYLENIIRPGRKGMEAMMMYASVTSHTCATPSLSHVAAQQGLAMMLVTGPIELHQLGQC
jgi:hypothetical protein